MVLVLLIVHFARTRSVASGSAPSRIEAGQRIEGVLAG
jgi:hypothetical protein